MFKGFRPSISFFLLAAGALYFVGAIALDLPNIKEKVEPIRVYGTAAHATLKRSIALFVCGDEDKKTFQSIEEQTYEKFRVVHIADDRKESIQAALKECLDDEVVCFLKSGDVLAHEDVLCWINYCYEDPTVLITYGNALLYPSYKKVGGRQVVKKFDNIDVRKLKLDKAFPGLRTIHASLAKSVKMEENAPFEEAFFYPALEIAGQHARFVKDVLVIVKDR